MTYTRYSDARPGDPEIQVRVTLENGATASGFIHARRQRDDVREAYVDYSYTDAGGFTHRRDWLPMDQLTVLTIDDGPQGGHVIPPP